VDQLPDGAKTVEHVCQVLTAARSGGYPIFYTRHMSLPPELMGTAQLRTAMAWQHVDDPEKVESWFLRDTPGFQIVPDLSLRADEAVFDKLAMSAFAGTPLEMAL
jgi:nicotinamidase-related amidase